MGGFSNTTYKDTVNSIVSSAKETIKNPYYLWSGKSPTIVNYYSIDKKASTLDEGSLQEYSKNGKNSPIKYNRIKEFIIYGLDQIQTNLVNDEYGLQGEEIQSEAFVLPNTIIPCSGDYFTINYLKEKIVFMVTEVSFDTLDNGSNMYRFQYELSPYDLKDIENNVIDDFKFIINNVGSEFDCVIRNSLYEQINKLDSIVETLKDYFITLYYNERVQTFTFKFLENNFYDPYMIEFIIRNDLMSFNGNKYIYIDHQVPKPTMFPIEYKKTLFYALELCDKENIRLYRNKAQGTLIKNRMTTFYNRPEAYFQITYDTFTKDWGIIPTFFDELIDHIESGELFGDEEGIFPIYNIIIKYFNNLNINESDLTFIDRFDIQKHHLLFYAIPALIFCIIKKMDSLMQKD